MEKHRKLFKYCFLAMLCIGLVSAAFYYSTDAAGHGNPSSNGNLKLGKDGRKWLTIRVYSTDGKYDSSIKGKLPNETGYDTWLSYKFPNSSKGTNTGKDNLMTDTTENTAASTDKSKVTTLAWENTVGGTFGILLDDDDYTYKSNNRKNNYVRQAGLSYQFKIGKQKGYHFSATSPALTTSSDIYVAKGDGGIVKAGIAKVKHASDGKDDDLDLWKWGNAVDYTQIYNGKGATKTCSVVIDAQDFNSDTTINIALAPNTLTINYDGNGGTPSPASQSANYGTKITWNATASGKTGYHVTGWTDESGSAVSLNVEKGANAMAKLVADKDYGIERKNKTATLKASWTPNNYTITYTAEKPTNCTQNITGSTTSTAATYDSDVTLSSTYGFSLPGYKRSTGWLDSSDIAMGSTAKNLTPTQNGSVQLHHHFAPYAYTVYYKANTPSYASITGSTQTSQIMTVDSTTDKLSANPFAVTGATFLGWSNVTTGDKKYSAEQRVGNVNGVNANLMLPTADNQSTNLYAIWRPIQYYVQYNSNYNSTGSTQTNTTVKKGLFDYGTSYTALKQSETGMSRPGYYIAYWTLNADGTGDRFYSGDVDWPANQNSVKAQFSNLTTVDGATVNLYAHWEPIKYTLTYSSNDSLGGVNPDGTGFANITEVHYYNEEITLKKNQWTRKNGLGVSSVFQGWNLASDANSSDKSIKYTAKWADCGKFINGDSNPLCTTRNGNITICAVWNDVPELVATDYEIPFYSNSGGSTVGDLISTNDAGEAVLSKTALERVLLENAVSRHSDREDGELPLGEHFFIEYFHKPSFENVEHPTAFEIKYTVVDSKGERYQQSAMLYCGYLIRIDVD